jgi:hypothetical protein
VLLYQEPDEVPEGTLSCPIVNSGNFEALRPWGTAMRLTPPKGPFNYSVNTLYD